MNNRSGKHLKVSYEIVKKVYRDKQCYVSFIVEKTITKNTTNSCQVD